MACQVLYLARPHGGRPERGREAVRRLPNVSTALAPLETLDLPPDISGASGQNRGSGRAQIAAKDDRSAVLAWLARYADSQSTLDSYRKEAERLLLWCLFQHQRALSDLTHEDLLLYQVFLKAPAPAERWVMEPGQKAARSSPRWRPFAGPLSESSQRQAMSILNGLFNWLVQAGYLAGNPLALQRRRRKRAAPRIERFLPHEHWAAVKVTILAMPTGTPRDAAHAARTRWLFSLLYIGGLRVSEVCAGQMADIFVMRGHDGRERWWLEATGKGEKTRLVPVTSELLNELKTYRLANGLKPQPSAGDDPPLILPLIGPRTKPMARTAIHEIVKATMRACADRLRAQGPEFEAAAAHIESASTHWLRHTAASHQISATGLVGVRDNLGHESISTSNLYLHTEDEARHDATEKGHRVSWSI